VLTVIALLDWFSGGLVPGCKTDLILIQMLVVTW